MQRQPATIHYRRLVDVTNAFNSKTLESAVREALSQKVSGSALSEHWKKRAWLVPPGNQDTLLTNIFENGDGFFFGDLTQYTKGFMQSLLSNMEDVAMLEVEQQPPPEGKEYIHSMMYWMVIGNHVFIIQSRSLNAKHLEEYLTWLLKDRTGILGPVGHVLLQAQFDAEDVGGDLDDISEIIVGGLPGVSTAVVEPPKQVPAIAESDTYREIAARKPWPERAMDVLKAVMNSEADLEELLESIPAEADLQVSVRIGYKSKKRKVSRAPMQQALRNLPEGEIKALGKNGRQSGKDVRLSYPARIATKGSLLEPGDVVRALREAYSYFVSNGKIAP